MIEPIQHCITDMTSTNSDQGSALWQMPCAFISIIVMSLSLSLAGVAAPTSSAAAPVASIDALSAKVLAAAKIAAGGAAWDSVRTMHCRFLVHSDKKQWVDEEWDDVQTGRSVDRSTLGPSSISEGFDGTTHWIQDSNGAVLEVFDRVRKQQLINGAYMVSNGFWYPLRFPATIVYAKTAVEGKRWFDVLSITPQGGTPFQLWFDQATGLQDREVMPFLGTVHTVYFSD